MDAQSKYQPRYVAPDRVDGRLVAKGTLKHGLKIGTDVYREFVMREALAEDVFMAERDADAGKPLTFAAEMMALQLVSVGNYKGPFTRGMIGTLRQADYRRLREAQAELDLMGELE
jgi:phage FluMu protein gp41